MIDKKDFRKKLAEGFGRNQILILLLAGILLLILTMPERRKEESESRIFTPGEAQKEYETQGEYAEMLEARLEEILSQIDGAGEVSVMITFQSSAEKVVEKDLEKNSETVTETDSQGGTRTTRNESRRDEAVYSEAGGEGQEPYISKELSPKVEGVVVIAPGGDNAVVAKNITESVQALFGIDTHKIRIVKDRREA